MSGPPREPEQTYWNFPDLSEPAVDRRHGSMVAIGADLAPGTLLSAYRRGLFPMPGEDHREPMNWWSPTMRGVLPLDGLRVSRSLRQSRSRYRIRIDTAFEEVLRACADPARPGAWIDERIQRAYRELHRLGWAHSVEAWEDGRLAGGLYGVAIGGLFAGESMFHRRRDASKVALVALVELLRDEYADRRLLDVQWATPHLASLGVVEIPRGDYLGRLRAVLAAGVPQPRAFGGAVTPPEGPSRSR